jgi:hypothetical protein
VNEVTANVHEGAAAALNPIANVGRIHIEVAEDAHDGAQFPNAALVEKFAQAKPLGVAVDHERFTNLDSGASPDGK